MNALLPYNLLLSASYSCSALIVACGFLQQFAASASSRRWLNELFVSVKFLVNQKFHSKNNPREEEEDDDDEEMDTTTKGHFNIAQNSMQEAPSTSGSTMQVEEEDLDPGWTIVKKGKRKN